MPVVYLQWLLQVDSYSKVLYLSMGLGMVLEEQTLVMVCGET